MSSYYRRFIPQFAHIAKVLHELTCKGVEFSWTPQCQVAFNTLSEKLAKAPALSYPSFDKPFVLQTDASIEGIGAVLSQHQEDRCLHPIAYASRALSPQERNYAITDLETLAVVWATSHFHLYIYGHLVTVYTDHSAVKTILQTPTPVVNTPTEGVKDVKIQYHPGKMNANADALSHCPQAPAPETGMVEDEVQIAAVGSEDDSSGSGESITDLLQSDSATRCQDHSK